MEFNIMNKQIWEHNIGFRETEIIKKNETPGWVAQWIESHPVKVAS